MVNSPSRTRSRLLFISFFLLLRLRLLILLRVSARCFPLLLLLVLFLLRVSGSGKSTLLVALLRLTSLETGRITVDGQVCQSQRYRVRVNSSESVSYHKVDGHECVGECQEFFQKSLSSRAPNPRLSAGPGKSFSRTTSPSPAFLAVSPFPSRLQYLSTRFVQDITMLPSSAVRRNVAVLPQEPTLFSGTLRFNLDPNGEYPDLLPYTRSNAKSSKRLP